MLPHVLEFHSFTEWGKSSYMGTPRVALSPAKALGALAVVIRLSLGVPPLTFPGCAPRAANTPGGGGTGLAVLFNGIFEISQCHCT